MQLLKLQQNFRDVLLQKDSHFALPLKPNGSKRTEPLFLYQNNLYESLYKNLSDKFAMTKAWLGEEVFFSQAKEYVFTVSQGSPYLCEYGESFPHTLENALEKELAELEWKMNLSLVSYRAESPLQFEDLVAVHPHLMSRFIFRFHASVQLYASSYALKDIWISLKKRKKIPAYKQKSYFFIFAENQQSFFFSLNESEYNFLKMIKEGKALGEAYDLLADADSFQQLLNKFIPYFVEITNKPF